MFEVTYDRIASDAIDFRSQADELRNLKKRLDGSLKNQMFSEKTYRQIRSALTRESSFLSRDASSLTELSSALSQIARTYQTAEDTVLGKKVDFDAANRTGNPTVHNGKSVDGGKAERWNPLDFTRHLSEFVKSFLKMMGEKDDKSAAPRRAAFASALLQYMLSLEKFLNAKNESDRWQYFTDFAGASGNAWCKMYDGFLKLLKYDADGKRSFGTGLFSAKGQKGAAIVDVAFGSAGMVSSVIELFNGTHQGYDFWGEAIDGVGGSTAEFAYDACEFAQTMAAIGGKASSSGGIFTPAKLYLAAGLGILDAGGTAIKSYGKYAADGTYSVNDMAETGIDAGVSGLRAIVDCLTFGMSSEAATGLSTESIIEGIKGWGRHVGTELGKASMKYGFSWIFGK